MLKASLFLISVATAAPVAGAGWNLVLSAEAVVHGDVATLQDVTSVPVPEAVANLVVHGAGRPGQTANITRRGILRHLVSTGQAAGVRLSGAETCRISFAGHQISTEDLYEKVRRVLQPLVPVPEPGAPATWFELDLPDRGLSAAGDWKIRIDRDEPLSPGRNLVRIQLTDGDRSEAINALVILHCFREVARLRVDLERDAPLAEELLTWEWLDLAETGDGLALGRRTILSHSATRSLTAGKLLRQSDLKATPLIESGQPVELQVVRGSVAVSVRAFARQSGCLGQVIPVRNELTGRLVNAKIAGPGLVEWRR